MVLAACAPPVPDNRCHVGAGVAEVAEAARAGLAADGWRDVVVERYQGQVLVRARRGTRGIAGKLETGAPGCQGVRVDLREVVVGDGPGATEAGPMGVRTSRPPTR